MKKFTFRLQTVLDMRKKVLEDKRLEMAKVIKRLNLQIEKLEELKERQEKLTEELNGIYDSDEIDIGGMQTYKSFISKLFGDIKSQEKVINDWKKLLHVKQLEVNEALKQVKILEKLKEKEEKKFNDHINYLEEKEADDLTTTRYQAKFN
ncbi:flagellar export protein FliJ [bacterium]|nr:flagellar export protein FliJ [bacterium]